LEAQACGAGGGALAEWKLRGLQMTMAGAAAGTAHLCTRCPCLLLSSLPRGLRSAARRLSLAPLSSSLCPSLPRDGVPRARSGRFIGALAPARPRLAAISTTSRRELSVRAKVVETGSAVVEENHELEPVPSSSVPEFRKRLRVAEIKGGEDGGLERVGQTMTVRGWVRTCRLQKTFTFIEVIFLSLVQQLNSGLVIHALGRR
jgi:hypothetical protein